MKLSRSEIARKVWERECIQRQIKTLELTLQNAREKEQRLCLEIHDGCDHEYELTGTDLSDMFKITKEVHEVKCKWCGEVTWKFGGYDV